MTPIEEGARYAGFWSRLDCQVCGDEIEVEGDVTNGQTITCENCDNELEIYGR